MADRTDSCHGKSKTKATKRRKELNKKGKSAHVVQKEGNFCVVVTGTRKKRKKR